MKFFCEKDNISGALLTVQKAIALRNPLPILSGILFELKENTLSLTATNLEMGIKCSIQVNGERNGSTVLPARQIVELTRRLPDATILFETNEDTFATSISYANSQAEFFGFPSSEFPTLPPVEGSSFALGGQVLKDILKQVLFAVGNDENRPVFTGVLVHLTEGEVVVVATDTHRLALRRKPLEGQTIKDAQIIIPGKTFSELNKIVDGSDEVLVTVTENQVFFSVNETIVMSRLIEGKYPNYKQVIPTEFKTTLKMNNKNLLESLERSCLLLQEGKQTIKLKLSSNKLLITVNTELGRICEELDMELTGEVFDISFNAKYLIDTLKALNSEDALVKLTGPTSAGIVKSPDSDDYQALVLPIWVEN